MGGGCTVARGCSSGVGEGAPGTCVSVNRQHCISTPHTHTPSPPSGCVSIPLGPWLDSCFIVRDCGWVVRPFGCSACPGAHDSPLPSRWTHTLVTCFLILFKEHVTREHVHLTHSHMTRSFTQCDRHTTAMGQACSVALSLGGSRSGGAVQCRCVSTVVQSAPRNNIVVDLASQ